MQLSKHKILMSSWHSLLFGVKFQLMFINRGQGVKGYSDLGRYMKNVATTHHIDAGIKWNPSQSENSMIFVVFAAANWSENSIQSKHLSPSNPNYPDIQPGSPAFHGGRGSELLKVELVGI